MAATIVNNRIAGTRITVFDVFYYLDNGRSYAEIQEILRIKPEELQAALEFIDHNQEYVLDVHHQIEERNARGNPPELQAKLDAMHAEFLERVRRMKEAERIVEINHAAHPAR